MYVSCTSHFIKTSTIEAAILNAIKAMTKEIIENEDEFAEQLQVAWENQNTQVSSESKKELHSVQKRIDELDALIRSLYENSVLGKIPERQYQRLMAQYDEEQAVCEARIAELKKELDVVETTKVDLKRFIKLIRKYKDCETLTDEMLYELVEKVVIHSASGGRTIYRQQQIDIYFNFIGDMFPSQIEISRGDKKNLTEQQLAKRKKYQKTSGENRKKKRAALREAAKTDPQAAAEYEALLQKGRERCRKYIRWSTDAMQVYLDKYLHENFGDLYTTKIKNCGAVLSNEVEYEPSVYIEATDSAKYPWLSFVVTGEQLTMTQVSFAIYALYLPTKDFQCTQAVDTIEQNQKYQNRLITLKQAQNPKIKNYIESINEILISGLEAWLNNNNTSSMYD